MRMERKDAFEDGVSEGLALGREEGLAAGREEERSQIFELMAKMIFDGLGDQISKLANDPTFYEDMMLKYLGR